MAFQQEFQGKPEISDRKQMEALINAAVEKARKGDEAYQNVQRECERVISHWECHYFGSARVYCLAGYGFAQAMKGLLPNQLDRRR